MDLAEESTLRSQANVDVTARSCLHVTQLLIGQQFMSLQKVYNLIFILFFNSTLYCNIAVIGFPADVYQARTSPLLSNYLVIFGEM